MYYLDILLKKNDDYFVIAEIGNNHQGDLNTAIKMIESAKQCGVNAVKFQKRDNKTLFTDEFYSKPYSCNASYGKTYGEHREFLEFDKDQYASLMAHARKIDILMFSTAFDKPSVDFLEDIGNPIYKVASADLDNIPLLEYISSTGKPIIISTGAATMQQVEQAYNTVKQNYYPPTIMQCTCMYPVEYDKINLNVIKRYKEIFPDSIIGYSGHESDILLPVLAYVLGARILEKHFTLNKTWKGTDHKFSLDPDNLKEMMKNLELAKLSLGHNDKYLYKEEVISREKMGKSLYANQNIKEGTIIRNSLVSVKSPSGKGLSPSMLKNIIGKRAKCDIECNQILQMKSVNDE